VRGSSGASPFASALDDALAADRPSVGSDRAAERRSTPDDRAARAGQRVEDARARVAERTDRAAAHADRAADRASGAATTTAVANTDAAADPTDPTGAAADAPEETAGCESADAAQAGLHPADLWAMTLGGPLPTAAPAEIVDGARAVLPAGATAAADGPVVPAATAPIPAASATAAELVDLTVVSGSGTGAGTLPGTGPSPIPAMLPSVPATTDTASMAPVAGSTTSPVETAAAAPPVVAAPTTAGTSAPATADITPAGLATGAPVAPGGSQSSGAGNSGTGSGAPGTPAGDGITEVNPLGPATAPAPALVTPVPSAGATGSAAALPVGSQVARHVAVLGSGPDGAQTMTLVLNPENLGPVEVSVTLSKGTVDLTLRGAHELGRAALLDGLPDLRRDLEAAGLNPSRLEVDRDTGGSWLSRHTAQQQADQQAFGQRGDQQNRGHDVGVRSRPWGAPADTAGSGPIPPRNRSASSSGVDVLA